MTATPLPDAHVIPFAPLPDLPWRNGLGTTREILRWPSTDAWQWRLSLATSSGPAPFSRFPGVQRHLMPVMGAGLRLRHDDGRVDEVQVGGVRSFSGTQDVVGEPVAGVSHQLNLMWRPEAVSASIDGLVRDSDSTIQVVPAACRIFHLLDGRAWFGPGATPLHAQDTLVLSATDRVRQLPLKVDGTAVAILVTPPSSGSAT